MPRKPTRKPTKKLKTYQTSLGFYDQAIAAPSMKAALDAWGARSNLFHQGIAKETDDPDIVAATMAAPGVVLRRPVGSDGPFTEHSDLPTDLGENEGKPKSRARKKRSAKRPAKSPAKRAATSDVNDRQARAAAAAFAREEQRREAARRKEEAARARDRARREKAVAAAEAALEKARRDHEARAGAIEAERAALEERAAAEEARWDKQRKTLADAVRRARE